MIGNAFFTDQPIQLWMKLKIRLSQRIMRDSNKVQRNGMAQSRSYRFRQRLFCRENARPENNTGLLLF